MLTISLTALTTLSFLLAASPDAVLISVSGQGPDDLISTASGGLLLLGLVYRHCLNASAAGNAVSVMCHSRHRDSHVSIRKERKTLQQAFVSKQFGFE